MSSSTDWYARQAKELFRQYEAADPEVLHRGWLPLLDRTPGLALDLGAGSGRDAAWLRARGWEVVAVEPAGPLRELARERHGDAIHWLDDRLPELKAVRQLGFRFRLILCSAVWMHLTPPQQERALRILSELLAPGGLLVITVREGPDDKGRAFQPVDPRALLHQARARALDVCLTETQPDHDGRDGVQWRIFALRSPDDGSGGLPVLRHIIINDNKSATYKLGLLRALVRSIDGSPGLVLDRDDRQVTLPFGLVALNWLKLYLPLVCHNRLQQTSNPNRGLGFAGDAFYALAERIWDTLSLRPGTRLHGDMARLLTRALRDICATIQKMPAHYTTWPGSGEQIFECRRGRVSTRNEIRLDRDWLASFGEFRIPLHLWQSMAHYACWLEPAIEREWANLIQGWQGVTYQSGSVHEALRWQEPERSTAEVRAIMNELLETGRQQPCIWTERRLRRETYHVDHCLPWSRWYNNDLWNLMPITGEANSRKGDRLPAMELLLDSRERILDWWDTAFLRGDYRARFADEASASLPLATELDPEEVFNALTLQRTRLKIDQQIEEWGG